MLIEPFDRACRTFLWYPAHAFEVQTVLNVDPVTAHQIFVQGLRVPAAQRLVWLNDIAPSLYCDVPLVVVQTLMGYTLTVPSIYERSE